MERNALPRHPPHVPWQDWRNESAGPIPRLAKGPRRLRRDLGEWALEAQRPRDADGAAPETPLLRAEVQEGVEAVEGVAVSSPNALRSEATPSVEDDGGRLAVDESMNHHHRCHHRRHHRCNHHHRRHFILSSQLPEFLNTDLAASGMSACLLHCVFFSGCDDIFHFLFSDLCDWRRGVDVPRQDFLLYSPGCMRVPGLPIHFLCYQFVRWLILGL
mmetsp:Transcript_36874/g.55685  ORF Transcript_36874/g.55685 Transcript_36874/m.55685 type:complete len:216 (-) Transcript_36874:101-748(-)